MPWQDFEIVGFVPDLPQNIPGAVFASQNDGTQSFGMYPTAKGFRNGPTPETLTTSGGTSGALDTVPLGSAIVYKTDGSARIFVGTAAKLWEHNGGAIITDRTGPANTATPTNSWSFAQFGDVTLAAHRGQVIQQISSASTFASVGSNPVPQASIIVMCGPVSAPFIMALDFNDGTHDWRDGWFNSAISDPISGASTAWTVGTSQCDQGRLLDDLPGPITAGVAFRDEVIAFKQKGMYIGTYGTKIEDGWSWERRAHDVGCLGKNCCVSVEDMVLWADANGLWQYDGSYPRRLPGHIHKWWSEQVINLSGTAATRNLARVVWDPKRRNIWFMLPDDVGQTTGLVYHVDSQLWFPVYTIVNHGESAIVFEFVGILGNLGYFVGVDKKMGTMTYDNPSGGPAVSGMTFGVIGDNIHQYTCTEFRPLILRTDLAATTVSVCTVASGDFWRDNMLTLDDPNHSFVSNNAKLHQQGNAAGRFLQPLIGFTANNSVEIAAKGGKINLIASGAGGA